MRWSVRFCIRAVDKSIQITGEVGSSLIGGLRKNMIAAFEHISDVQCGGWVIEIGAADRIVKRRLPVLLTVLIAFTAVFPPTKQTVVKAEHITQRFRRTRENAVEQAAYLSERRLLIAAEVSKHFHEELSCSPV
ncbi:sodium:proton antiporter, putative [Babesia ovata]|uniref:Sodium:proton antiporter, putative n=1 Tax=Babesia ovata TaxID=189622 RepID=A0A2H6KKH6_9APIC|nr:sodium:proton antiporter, putative [Babesia ovata]XP_028869733.1 sodium:proton antiporter, putative [Babesia ovata]GBE63041.1 sodium:proton antiporter, putative [Babesia ovata]GBE63490.1 sodium:proton antiporter, putative [Babesia ovata]